MRPRLLFFSIFAYLCTSASLCAQSAVPDSVGKAVPDEVLSAALCERDAWNAAGRGAKNAALLSKAEHLAAAGEYDRAWQDICRIGRFGLSHEQMKELTVKKLLYAHSAGMAQEFEGVLAEAMEMGYLDDEDIERARDYLSGNKPRHRSENAAMLLSVLPGAGNAYSGEWGKAFKYFACGATSLALGVGAFVSGLYVPAFLGTGMLLNPVLPRCTAEAISDTESYNRRQLIDYYTQIIEDISTN